MKQASSDSFSSLPLPKHGNNSGKFFPNQTRYIPLTDWPNHHPWPKLGGLRHLVFHSLSNGFEKVIRRAGRRVLIDEQAFFVWLDKQGGNNNG